jgi:hypothetical protein
MKYIKNYIESLKYLTEFNSDFKNSKPDFKQSEDAIIQFWENRDQDYYKGVLSAIQKIIELMLKQYKEEDITRKCHGVSNAIWWNLRESDFAKITSLNITIGNVYYKGSNIYGLDKYKLKNIISQGPQLDRSLDVHVWLTADNMTVIDPTIMHTLHKKGVFEKPEYQGSPVLLWREDIESDFYYEPLLVDNEFVSRVDNVEQIVPM